MEAAGEILVQVRELQITYPSPTGLCIHPVDGLSLEIGYGEIVGILGESGCGKSTLANAISRMLPLEASYKAGSVCFRGRDLLKLPECELGTIRGREISLVGQDPALALNPVIRVGTQIAEVLRAHLSLSSRERAVRVAELLGEVGFERPNEIADAYPHQLSGGQRQRIVIAQAVACRPALVIADEATSKLDASLQADILVLLAEVRRKYRTALLVISHDPALFAGLADRLAVMYAGRIVEIGSTAQILGRPLHPYTQALVAIARSALFSPSEKHFAAISGDSPNPASFPIGCRFEPRCPEKMDVCARRYPQAFVTEPSQPVNCFKYGE